MSYPGTSQHQALLHGIAAHYESDPRILAVAIFGSLGRGNWDEYSDIDLDIVIADGVMVDAMDELHNLCAALSSSGEIAAMIIPDGDDSGEVVFESLMLLSVRYHPLEATHPNIVDSLQVLSCRIDPAAIVAAGTANRRYDETPASELVDHLLRYAVVADAALQRQRFWEAEEILQRMRALLMALYAAAQGKDRPVKAFQAGADEALQSWFGRSLPGYSHQSLKSALGVCLDIIENGLGQLTGGKVQLTDAQRAILRTVQARYPEA